MIGDATKSREQFLGLEKKYTFKVLFGIKTDTYDVLGLMTKEQNAERVIVNEKVNIFVNSHIGIQQQSYPPFSSKAVEGKPLFSWARENKLSEIQIPQKTIEIKEFTAVAFHDVEKQNLQKRITSNLSLIRGDFRQKEIIAQWDSFFNNTRTDMFQTAEFQISCSSGTYVRGLVHELGKYLGCGAIALDILRTSVGKFTLDNSLKL
jgi:tRNA pseudouridine55 synthase